MDTKLPTIPETLDIPADSGKTIQKIKYPCGCEAVGVAPMPADCPTHGASTQSITERQTIHVAVILDESGSMESCRQQTIDGFNEYLKGLKKDQDSDYIMTLTKFDAHAGDPTCRVVFANSPIWQCPDLTTATFTPRGSTPMYDAIGQTINKIDGKSAAKFLVVTITDGGENASREFNKDSVKKLIAQKEVLGNWTFVYLGANQDAWAEAQSMGFAAGNVANYKTANMGSVMRGLVGSTRMYAASARMSTSNYFDGAKEVGTPDASELGRRGGKKRAAGMTPGELRLAAADAAKARWKK
jgi:hypothetical protein